MTLVRSSAVVASCCAEAAISCAEAEVSCVDAETCSVEALDCSATEAISMLASAIERQRSLTRDGGADALERLPRLGDDARGLARGLDAAVDDADGVDRLALDLLDEPADRRRRVLAAD